jgi:hypothetical protein
MIPDGSLLESTRQQHNGFVQASNPPPPAFRMLAVSGAPPSSLNSLGEREGAKR